jgi:hypothetical protein
LRGQESIQFDPKYKGNKGEQLIQEIDWLSVQVKQEGWQAVQLGRALK